MARMTDSELIALLADEERSALGYLGGELTEQRRKALEYYMGKPFGNEVEGRSQVVITDVADTIEWILPALLKVFTAGDDIVRFEPMGPEDEEAAAQATEYVNWIFNRDNDGFLILYTLFKDALLQKNGIAKVWWEEKEEDEERTLEGLDDGSYGLLLIDPEIEIVEHEAIEAAEGMAGPDGVFAEVSPARHRVKYRKKRTIGRAKVANVPPEEFLISPRAKCIQDAAYVAHRVRRRVSDLIAEGYDRKQLESISGDDTLEFTEEAQTRREFDEESLPDERRGVMREVWINEEYVLVDYDGDGIAERRQITRVGGKGGPILRKDGKAQNIEWDGPPPFVSVTPIIMPHRFFGMSIADIVMDLQLIKSTIMRQFLDNLYLSNNARHVISDAVNLDDMLTSRPGGLIRLKNGALPSQGHVVPLAVQDIAGHALPALEYLDSVKENRTGVTRYNQGMDADTLNKTASGISQIMTAAQQRIELIARIFAETGVKDLFAQILRLVSKHQNEPRVIRLRNRWVPMDPRGWESKFDLSINVGLGTGNRDQMLAHLMNLLGLQAQAIQFQGGAEGPLVTLRNVYETARKIPEAMGFKSPDPFFTDPEDPNAPKPQPQPSPEEMKIQAEMQRDQAKLKMEAQKAQADAQLEAQRFQQELALKERQMEAEIRLKREQLAAELQLKREQLAAELALKRDLGVVNAAAKATSSVQLGGEPG